MTNDATRWAEEPKKFRQRAADAGDIIEFTCAGNHDRVLVAPPKAECQHEVSDFQMYATIGDETGRLQYKCLHCGISIKSFQGKYKEAERVWPCEHVVESGEDFSPWKYSQPIHYQGQDMRQLFFPNDWDTCPVSGCGAKRPVEEKPSYKNVVCRYCNEVLGTVPVECSEVNYLPGRARHTCAAPRPAEPSLKCKHGFVRGLEKCDECIADVVFSDKPLVTSTPGEASVTFGWICSRCGCSHSHTCQPLERNK